jgi:hypothetical protein
MNFTANLRTLQRRSEHLWSKFCEIDSVKSTFFAFVFQKNGKIFIKRSPNSKCELCSRLVDQNRLGKLNVEEFNLTFKSSFKLNLQWGI